jgi:hypothetical protein
MLSEVTHKKCETMKNSSEIGNTCTACGLNIFDDVVATCGCDVQHDL